MRVLLVLVAVVLAGCFGGGEPLPSDEPEEALPPPMVAFRAAVFETDAGTITIVLYPRFAPLTVVNFERLVRDGYYDGLPFHRVVDDFVIQTGDGDDARRVPLETHEVTYFSGGALGVARGTEPDSGGPQFFITDHAQPHLKWPNGTASESFGAFTMFGQVVEGMDVVRRIAAAPTVPGLDRPVEEVLIQEARLVNLNLTEARAATLPLVTTDRQENAGYRLSFEYPANLVAGAAANVTWYASPRSVEAGGPLADPAMEMEAPDGAPLEVVLSPTAADAGVLEGRATFPTAGTWWVRLLDGDQVLAGFQVDVPAATPAAAS